MMVSYGLKYIPAQKSHIQFLPKSSKSIYSQENCYTLVLGPSLWHREVMEC